MDAVDELWHVLLVIDIRHHGIEDLFIGHAREGEMGGARR